MATRRRGTVVGLQPRKIFYGLLVLQDSRTPGLPIDARRLLFLKSNFYGGLGLEIDASRLLFFNENLYGLWVPQADQVEKS